MIMYINILHSAFVCNPASSGKSAHSWHMGSEKGVGRSGITAIAAVPSAKMLQDITRNVAGWRIRQFNESFRLRRLSQPPPPGVSQEQLGSSWDVVEDPKNSCLFRRRLSSRRGRTTLLLQSHHFHPAQHV